jgi:hypothetical protein
MTINNCNTYSTNFFSFSFPPPQGYVVV